MPCPSAHDPARNRHRSGIAWSKGAVRAILTNPRYTGYQVWNRQRKDEVLIDVDDVGLGHMSKLRWNAEDKWVWSDTPAHPPIVSREDFTATQRDARQSGPSLYGQDGPTGQPCVPVQKSADLRALRSQDARGTGQRHGLLPMPLP
ncbi:recombinase family protein [Nonomuraea dietziae]|uniref:recombinase family protein n=1 Tax=Nonomuraea dietziae TaxID=65515 RepID=UPI00343E52E9